MGDDDAEQGGISTYFDEPGEDDRAMDELGIEPGDVVELEWSRPGGTTTARARFTGPDAGYVPGEWDRAGPRLEFEDLERDDRDLAVYPNSLGPLGSIAGVYGGDRSPDERALGELERLDAVEENGDG